MSIRPWYKRYGADFIHGTMGLTLEQKGAYSLCLDLIYEHGGPIPDDDRWLAGICGVSMRKWRSLRAALIEAGKLSNSDGFLMNDRAEMVLAEQQESHRKSVESGAKGGRKVAERSTSATRKVPEKEVPVNENNDLDQGTLKHLEERREEKIYNKPPPPKGGSPPLTEVPKQSRKKDARHGTRLEADWQLCEAGRKYARGRGFTDQRIDDIAENFRDYWTCGAGRNKTHLDWHRAWQTWVRNTRSFPVADRSGNGGVVAAVRELIGEG